MLLICATCSVKQGAHQPPTTAPVPISIDLDLQCSRFRKNANFIVSDGKTYSGGPIARIWRGSVLRPSSQPLRKLLTAILSFPCSVTDDEAVQGRIRAEQISNIKRYLSAMLV